MFIFTWVEITNWVILKLLCVFSLAWPSNLLSLKYELHQQSMLHFMRLHYEKHAGKMLYRMVVCVWAFCLEIVDAAILHLAELIKTQLSLHYCCLPNCGIKMLDTFYICCLCMSMFVVWSFILTEKSFIRKQKIKNNNQYETEWILWLT